MFLHRVDDEVSLKLLELKDAKDMFELTDHSREYLREWLGWLDFIKVQGDTEQFINSCLTSYAEDQSLNTVILYKGEMVGTIGFNSINRSNKSASIGYWLAEPFQGKGIMTKTAKALTDYAINELKLNRVEIRVAKENKKSKAIPEKLGFVNEGCMRQAEWLYDHYVDHLVYGMLAEDWNK